MFSIWNYILLLSFFVQLSYGQQINDSLTDHEKKIFNISTTQTRSGFYPPKEGNAVVYFVRVGDMPKGNWEFFHEDQYIGKWKGQGYIRYECPPGKQLFWASSENREFITTELETGKTYIILVYSVMGFWKAHVSLYPISMEEPKKMRYYANFIKNNKVTVMNQSKLISTNEKLQSFIEKQLNHYRNVTINRYNFRHLAIDQFVPDDILNPN